jgi:hypothetical protein
MGDIVTTLRTKAKDAAFWGDDAVVALSLEEANNAAAEIERLRAEVALLKNEVDGWRQWDDVDPQIKGECLREARERRIATDTARKESGNG